MPASNGGGYRLELIILAQGAAKASAIACLPFYLGIIFYAPVNFLAFAGTTIIGWVMSFPALAVFAAWSLRHRRKGLPCYPLYLLAGAVAALICGVLYGVFLCRWVDDEAGRVAVLFGMPIVFFMAGAITAGIHWQWRADRLQDDKRG